MVLIREADENEAAGDSNNAAGPSGSGNQRSNSAPSPPAGSFIEFCKSDIVFTVIAWLRLATLYFTLHYVLGLLGINIHKTSYSKAFIAAAASNAFRLHQRLRPSAGNVFSREFLAQLFVEDSAHYFLYCISFVNSTPVTMAIFPIAGYALLHTLSYFLKVADVLHQTQSGWAVSLHQFQQQYTYTILSTIACVEIFVFPVFCAMILTGKVSVLFIFIYYRFLWLRYASRRNPHTRLAFQSLKYSLLDVTNKDACPAFAKNAINQCIAFIERFAPPVQA